MHSAFSLLGQLAAVASIEPPPPIAFTGQSRAVQKGNDTRYGPLRAARAQQILDYLHEHQPAGRTELAKHVGCKPDTLSHTLRAMGEQKLVRSIGVKKGSRWVLYGYTDHMARMAA